MIERTIGAVARKGAIRRTINRIALYTFLLVCSILVIFPLFWMLSVAFKTDAEAIMYPPRLLPTKIYLDHFLTILRDAVFMRFFLNSLIVASVATVLSTTTSALAGFIFAKFRFFGRQFFFYALLVTIMIPFQTYMVPLYLLALKLKILNTRLTSRCSQDRRRFKFQDVPAYRDSPIRFFIVRARDIPVSHDLERIYMAASDYQSKKTIRAGARSVVVSKRVLCELRPIDGWSNSINHSGFLDLRGPS
jgi:hypothetical protein